MFDVISVGSATVDAFVLSDTKFMNQKGSNETMICYPLGSKILIKHLEFMTGGGGTNTAVAFSRLGLKTAFLGKIGNDQNGKKILSELKSENIKFIGDISTQNTAFSVILDSVRRDRTILAHKGASNDLRWNNIDKKKLKTKWFYFCSMLGESFKTQVKLAKYAKQNNIKILLNPSSYEAIKGKKYLKELLRHSDILIFNREEAGELLKKPANTKIEILLKEVRKTGPEIVIITEGQKQLYAYDGKFIYSSRPRKKKICETTGAGDAFASSFLAGYIKRKNIELSIKCGMANAESVVMHYGAKNKLLSWSELMRKIDRFKIKKTIVK